MSSHELQYVGLLVNPICIPSTDVHIIFSPSAKKALSEKSSDLKCAYPFSQLQYCRSVLPENLCKSVYPWGSSAVQSRVYQNIPGSQLFLVITCQVNVSRKGQCEYQYRTNLPRSRYRVKSQMYLSYRAMTLSLPCRVPPSLSVSVLKHKLSVIQQVHELLH